MKKAGLFVILLLVFSLIPLISAQDEILGVGEVPLVGELQQGQQQYEQYTTAENKSDYLKTEWNKILLKHQYIGPVMKVVNSIFEFLNPFFKIVLGVEYSLSWAFIFAIIIWLVFLFLFNPIFSQMFNSGPLGLLASFATASLVGLSGAIRKAVDMLTLMINNVWIAWLSLLVAIILVFLAEMVGKKIKAKLKTAKENAEKAKTEEAQKVIQSEGRIAKEEIESRANNK